MKKTFIWIFVLLLLVATIVSCESLFMDEKESTTTVDYEYLIDEQNPEAKFLGTWIYSDKNYGQAAIERGEDFPPDLRIEIVFTFRPGGTGTYYIKASNSDIVNEKKQEFLWSLDSTSPTWVLVVVRDNSATNFNLRYESAFFLAMNDIDLGKMYFAKQQ